MQNRERVTIGDSDDLVRESGLRGDLDAGHDVTINLHLGHQTVTHSPAASYTDWKIGATPDFGPVSGTLAWIGTNASELACTTPANGKFLGKNALQLTLGRTF